MKTAIIVPCYKVKNYIDKVISEIPEFINNIIIVDDFCPEKTGEYVKSKYGNNKKIVVLINKKNLGVGGATINGFNKAQDLKNDIFVKVDGDGQMDLKLLKNFLEPIINGQADYTKGNRFFNLNSFSQMPLTRIFGNILLSFLTKLSSGYWNLFDSTNGYIAIHSKVYSLIKNSKIDKSFFFESDMLNKLYVIKAKVIDIPITAIYNDSISNLKIHKIIFPFFIKNILNFFKRIMLEYFVLNFGFYGFSLILSIILMSLGINFGIDSINNSKLTGIPTNAGTVAITLILILTGFQLLILFINNDIKNYPKEIINNKF